LKSHQKVVKVFNKGFVLNASKLSSYASPSDHSNSIPSSSSVIHIQVHIIDWCWGHYLKLSELTLSMGQIGSSYL